MTRRFKNATSIKIEKRLQGVISILVDHRLEIPAKQIVNLFYESGLSFVSFFYLEKLADIDNFWFKVLAMNVLNYMLITNEKIVTVFDKER